MRMHLLFSLAFLSGVHGFAIFAPYLVAIVVIGHFKRGRDGAVKMAAGNVADAGKIYERLAIAAA